MNFENICFDDFMSYDSKTRKKIINDPELLKIMVRKNLKKSRYDHSLSVAYLSRELAELHHVDPDKAYITGLLHDCTKYLTNDQHDEYFRFYDRDKLNAPEPIKHSFSAKYYLKEKLNFHDKDILNAIYNHTICSSKDRLSLIIYIADKREPLRNIDDGIVELARKDLYKAYDALLRDVERYIKEVKNEGFIENSL
ncbi:MAG: bis(5'-nucleosyl)-tetraphosphatase (symmetrical) YqeK [Erysipelotrichaceae bacterium]|nr:bis(5'-nucleosyl)-tetraphosphatase (symmetrical) YqeK [Erysipelotrichaceae bacterium]